MDCLSAGLGPKALGFEEDPVVSDGTFAAVFEYDDATTFYPTQQTDRLEKVDDYVRCEDLDGIASRRWRSKT